MKRPFQMGVLDDRRSCQGTPGSDNAGRYPCAFSWGEYVYPTFVKFSESSLSGFCSSSFLPLWSFAAFLVAFFDTIIFLLPSDGPWRRPPCLYANPAPMFTMLIANRMAPGESARALTYSIRS